MIFADDREGKSIPQKLKDMGIEVVIKRLDVADYVITHSSYTVAVERKNASDYFSSITDGRLFDQLYKLNKSYGLSFIVIIGEPDYNRIKKDAFMGSLLSVALKSKQRVIPLQVKNEEDLCLILKSLNKQVEEGRLRTAPRMKKIRSDDNIAMLTAIPGIGEEKARKLLEKMGSVQKVVNASIADLKRVEGIGDKQAKKIYDFVRGRSV
ncbi:MAG: ERCC4 domain-containing protein [Archaeoglobaceae archaeon]